MRKPKLTKIDAEKAGVLWWMKQAKHEHDNATSLAEAAAHAVDHDEWLDDEQHWVWELAIQVIPGE